MDEAPHSEWQQPDLDFDRCDAELQLRLRWAANEASFVRECARVNTPEMRTISWMHGWRSVSDADLRWWNAKPLYERNGLIAFFESTRLAYADDPLPCHAKFPDFYEAFGLHLAELDQAIAREEAHIDEWAELIRKAFKQHQGCPIDISMLRGFDRDRAEHRLDQAIRRAGIPAECLQPAPPFHEKRRRHRHRPAGH